ncbi:MAG TPA: hypothetical protein VN958_01180 [Chitinophagaceae bacterium]|nr:hypothetical protein [Chitinophagaceae bacterium]
MLCSFYCISSLCFRINSIIKEESCTPVLLPDFLDIFNADDESVID